MKLQSQEEGFQDCQEHVLLHMEREIVQHYHFKLPAGNNLIPKRISNKVNSIFTSIPLLEAPSCLELPFEETFTVKLKEIEVTTADEPQVTLQEKFGLRRQHCVYSKFGWRADHSGELTTLFRNLDYHLDYSQDNYKRFTDEQSDLPSTSDGLQFSSNFESGNLMLAYRQPQSNEYELLLHNDINSHGYTQWFYFRVRNTQKCRARLRICNVIKPPHHFRRGMKISVFSLEQKRQCNRNWFKAGDGIVCRKNNIVRKTRSDEHEHYYSLEFSYHFEYPNDTVYFAMNVPFSYSRLMRLLKHIEQQDKHPDVVVKKRSLNYTVSNNDIQLVEVYNKRVSNSKAIIITARQHPCETVSSFVVEGILQFLMRSELLQLELLKSYHFFILPMLNPDGVVHGCSRLNLKGVDMNRQWVDIDKNLCNEAHTVELWLGKLLREIEAEYLIDLHGHSKKLSTFGYFSNNKPTTKAFANCLSETSRHFCYESCTFGIAEDKEKTLRSMADSLGVKNCITIESSYYGRLQNGAVHAYTNSDLHEIGQTLLSTIRKFISQEGIEEQVQLYLKAEKARQQAKVTVAVGQLINQSQRSDSDPEGDYLDTSERIEIESLGKPKHLEPNAELTAEERQRKLVAADGTNRRVKPSHHGNLIIKRHSRSENERYSTMRHRTEADEEEFRMVKELNLQRTVPSRRTHRKGQSNLYTTTSSFRGSIRLVSSAAGNRKYSVGKIPTSMTNYPTSMVPYLSRLSKNKFLQESMDIRETAKKSIQAVDHEKQKLQAAKSTGPVKFHNKLLGYRFLKRREAVPKRTPQSYTMLKQIISISSYGKPS